MPGIDNDTSQTVDQSQSGAGGTAIQEALQKAGNQQAAVSNAESTQVKPSNKNISVRVLSPGDNGSVSQSNNSSAESKAENDNELDQTLSQEQSGGECCEPKKPPMKTENGYGSERRTMAATHCCHGGTGIQAAGQEAYNKQYADSNAESKQIKPSNTNISVRVLSDGNDGDVEQSNNPSAESTAKNDNDTSQTIDQSQARAAAAATGASDPGRRPGCLQLARGQVERRVEAVGAVERGSRVPVQELGRLRLPQSGQRFLRELVRGEPQRPGPGPEAEAGADAEPASPFDELSERSPVAGPRCGPAAASLTYGKPDLRW